MLVLKRRVGESIVISGNIEIKLLGVSGESARLGIAAPPQVVVHRQEVHEQVRKSAGTAGHKAPIAEHSVPGKQVRESGER